jgi:tetratricopeptide (TPR) repeat protein
MRKFIMNKKTALMFVFSMTSGQILCQAQTSRELFRDGFVAYQKQDYKLASDLFEKGLKSDPSDVKAWQYYGNSLLEIGKKREARQALKNASDRALNSEEKASLQKKYQSLSLSIFPGENCRDLVQTIDPDLIKKIMASSPELPKVFTGNYEYSLSLSSVKLKTELCGDIYFLSHYQVEKTENSPSFSYTEVSLIGYPHLGALATTGEGYPRTIAVSGDLRNLSNAGRELSFTKTFIRRGKTFNSQCLLYQQGSGYAEVSPTHRLRCDDSEVNIYLDDNLLMQYPEKNLRKIN